MKILIILSIILLINNLMKTKLNIISIMIKDNNEFTIFFILIIINNKQAKYNCPLNT
jgi:hypothetical protein